MTFFTLLVGELAPKRVAMQQAERWALIAARPLAGLATAARPLIWLLSHATDLTVRAMGGDPGKERQEITEEEIRDEYDRDIRAVERREDGSFRVVGRFPLQDLEDLGIDLPDGDYVTVAGWSSPASATCHRVASRSPFVVGRSSWTRSPGERCGGSPCARHATMEGARRLPAASTRSPSHAAELHLEGRSLVRA